MPQHFVIDDVPVYADTGAAVAKDVPEEAGLIGYAKERSWEEDFATAVAVVVIYFPGSANIAMVPTAAVVPDGDTTRVYVSERLNGSCCAR